LQKNRNADDAKKKHKNKTLKESVEVEVEERRKLMMILFTWFYSENKFVVVNKKTVLLDIPIGTTDMELNQTRRKP
jgi:hypothetical protein